MKHSIILPLTLCSALQAFSASAAEKHVHGEAELFIAIEGNKVLIEMESPADNFLGFEHVPRTKQQKALVRSTQETLENYASLLILSKGNCKQIDAFIESPFSDHSKEDKEDHHDHGHEKDGHHDHDKKAKKDDHHDHGHKKDDHHDHDKHEQSEGTHSEYHITYTLECGNSDAINSANITAFDAFSNIEEIKVNWVNGEKQGSSEATTKSRQVSLK